MTSLPLGLIPAFGCDKSFTIGVQAIDYSPHYNFISAEQPNFFAFFVKWLEKKTGCKFSVVPLPIKRLELAFEQQTIDFIYPDNPTWQTSKISNNTKPRFYSPAIAVALGGTMVLLNHKQVPLSEFKTLAIPRGFTPVAWFPLQRKYGVIFREVNNAKAALMMVQAGRANGADIEYNVAQYLIDKHQLPPMTIAKNLPFTPTNFHLSTKSQVKMMQVIGQLINKHPSELNAMKKQLKLLESLPWQKPVN